MRVTMTDWSFLQTVVLYLRSYNIPMLEQEFLTELSCMMGKAIFCPIFIFLSRGRIGNFSSFMSSSFFVL